jgi:hypothetical protein
MQPKTNNMTNKLKRNVGDEKHFQNAPKIHFADLDISEGLTKTNAKQTQKNKFPPGNKIGNRFKKGETGNPNGRPKLTKLTDALRRQLAEIAPDAPEETIAEQIARALISEAKLGNIAAIREVFDRSEGKAPLTLDVGNKDGEPMVITFNFNNPNTRLIGDGE